MKIFNALDSDPQDLADCGLEVVCFRATTFLKHSEVAALNAVRVRAHRDDVRPMVTFEHSEKESQYFQLHNCCACFFGSPRGSSFLQLPGLKRPAEFQTATRNGAELESHVCAEVCEIRPASAICSPLLHALAHKKAPDGK